MEELKHNVQSRQEFLIAKSPANQTEGLSAADVGIMSPNLSATIVDGTVDISALAEVLDREGENLNIDLLESIPGQQTTVLVASMSANQANKLKEAYRGHLLVEKDAPLEMLEGERETDFELPELILASDWNSGIIPQDDEFKVNITVKEENADQAPVPGATVYLMGSLWFDKGFTDEDGKIELTLYGETEETIRSLLIKPKDTHWSRWYDNPDVKSNKENEIFLRRLEEHETLNGFPGQEVYGWGQKAMKLDQAANYSGKTIKIAIIDSGMDTAHGDLSHQVGEGRDFTGDNPDTWNQDTVGHGSHVAGVIAGLQQEAGTNKAGIRGFAPEAEIYVFKVFPGGKFSAIIKCLDRCIVNQVDVVNLSLGSKNGSEILQNKFMEAYNAGVACIAAAGNAKSDVMYPAAWDNVMAVAAIGQKGTFPDDSYHNRQVGEESSGDYFSAGFTCFGDEVDICAPGVAIVSSVPTGSRSYASWDGTSMACPHVVGLAALVLEAHDEIRSLNGGARVDALFQHLKENTEALSEIDQKYRGAGLPDAVKALGEPDGNGNNGGGDSWSALLELLEKAIQIAKKQENE